LSGFPSSDGGCLRGFLRDIGLMPLDEKLTMSVVGHGILSKKYIRGRKAEINSHM